MLGIAHFAEIHMIDCEDNGDVGEGGDAGLPLRPVFGTVSRF